MMPQILKMGGLHEGRNPLAIIVHDGRLKVVEFNPEYLAASLRGIEGPCLFDAPDSPEERLRLYDLWRSGEYKRIMLSHRGEDAIKDDDDGSE